MSCIERRSGWALPLAEYTDAYFNLAEVSIMRRYLIFTVALLAIGCSSHSATPVPQTLSQPQAFQGSGGNTWMYLNANSVGGFGVANWLGAKMSVLGDNSVTTFSEFGREPTIHLPHGNAQTMTVGPDGNLWVGEQSYIDSITPQGETTEYSLPEIGTKAFHMTSGADGAIWFTEGSAGELGRITTSGQIKEYPIADVLESLVSGPDGNIWVMGVNNVYRVKLNGTWTAFPIPGYTPGFLTDGPDGAMWYAAYRNNASYIGRLATDGSITTFDPPMGTGNFFDLTLGPDKLIWMFTPLHRPTLITFDPVSHAFGTPVAVDNKKFLPSNAMAFGRDGNLWVGGTPGNLVGVYLRQAIAVAPTSLSLQVGTKGSLTVSETNYQGSWAGSSSNKAVATIWRSRTPGVLTVTAVGMGQCSVTINDSMHNSIRISVTVQ